MPVERVNQKTLSADIRRHVDPSAIINTDEWPAYIGLGKDFSGHEVVNHASKQYSRKNRRTGDVVTTNSAESFNALLKRGHYGIFHQLSKKHLHRYCTEFAFRWSHRTVSDGSRMVEAIKGEEGRRLFYKQPVNKANSGIATSTLD